MKHHLICLTIDLDPDGLSGVSTNRDALTWNGLEAIQPLPEELDGQSNALGGRRVPITWFIRVDGQLRSAFGDALYLVRRFEDFFAAVQAEGDELAWHPHLYHRQGSNQPYELLTDPSACTEELQRLWEELAEAPFVPTAFRNGEGWHSKVTFEMVEKLGLRCDSTAIPGLGGRPGHPMDWLRAPNQPYFPAASDLCLEGVERPLLELPMPTWRFQASYDRAPKVRYMNPAIHPELFLQALEHWRRMVQTMAGELLVWVFILHPDEAMPRPESDLLYALSRQAVIENLVTFVEGIRRREESFEFTTVSTAAERWREWQGVV